MNIEITARNFTPSSQLKDFINDKLLYLLRFDSNIDFAKVVLLKESRAENIDGNGHEICCFSWFNAKYAETGSAVGGDFGTNAGWQTNTGWTVSRHVEWWIKRYA